jgi:hypothetical protein
MNAEIYRLWKALETKADRDPLQLYSRPEPPTAADVKEYRDTEEVGLLDAKRILRERYQEDRLEWIENSLVSLLQENDE